jgi:crotonobetainyl-CoA:carnitine CoA-transferase CaiB-like acyl-CoA transferase
MLSLAGYPEGHRWAGRPGYDALVQAASGQQWSQPGWRAGPIFLHMPMPSMGALFLVASGVGAALVARERTGRGQHVRTSLLQGALLYTTQIWQYGSAAPGSYHEMMSKMYPPGIHQQMVFECANRQWIHWSVMSGLTPTKSVDEVLGLDDAPDPFTFMVMSAEEREQINDARRKKFLEWDRDALTAELRTHNHAAEPIIPMDEAYAHEQLIANGMVATVDDPVVGETTQIGVPIHLLGTPGAIAGPQPLPGEHNDEILARELGLDAAQIAAAAGDAGRPVRAGRTTGIIRSAARGAPRVAPAAGGGPLDGIRLLDFGQYLAGPFGPMILGDLGAEVIKIEPVTGDGMRMSSKPFVGCQRGKRSLAVNVKSPEGLDVARRLIATADVVHHNMTKGVAARLGIDYAACRAMRWGWSTRPARRTPATHRSTTASACATPATRCSRSSVCCSPCTAVRAPGKDRSSGRRSTTPVRCSRRTRTSSTARAGTARGSTPTSWGSVRPTGCTAPRTAGSRWRR